MKQQRKINVSNLEYNHRHQCFDKEIGSCSCKWGKRKIKLGTEINLKHFIHDREQDLRFIDNERKLK